MFVYSIALAEGAAVRVYGQALVIRGISAFDELSQGFRDIDILSDPTAGQVTIGCPEAIASGVLGAVLVRFCVQFPRVIVNVEEANNIAHEYQMLRERKVDLLLGSITRPFVEEDVDAQVVYEDRPYITTGATNRLALRRRVEVAELLEQQWILPGESILRSVLEEALQAKGFALPRIGVKSYSVHQRITLLATGRFVCRFSFGAPSQRRRVLRNVIAGRSSDPFLASCYRHFEGPNDKPCSPDIRRLRARRV